MLNLIMQAAPAGAKQSDPYFFIMIALMSLVFYFLLIRPQNKRMKAHKAMLGAVTRGDTVWTNGGLIGKVTKATETELTVDLGAGVKVKVVPSMIANVVDKTAPANDTK